MPDRNVEIKLTTLADDAGAKATEKALAGVNAAVQKLEKDAPQAAAAVKKLQEAVNAQKKPLEDLKDGHDKATASTKNTGQAMLTTGRAIQDLQYGIGGVLNNIEALVMSLGGSAGLAGVLTLVSVAVAMLIPHLTKSGEEAKKSADEHAKLASKAEDAANAAEHEARNFALSSASLEAHEEAIASINKKYDEMGAAIERALKLRDDMRRQETMQSDAAAGLAMAQIDRAVAEGKMTPQQAEEARNKVESEAAGRRAKAEAEKLSEQEAAANALKAGAEAEAQEKRNEAAALAEKGSAVPGLPGDRGLLTGKEREALQQRQKQAEETMKIEEEKFLKAQESRRKLQEQEDKDVAAGRAQKGAQSAGIAGFMGEESDAKAKLDAARKMREDSVAGLRGDEAARNRSGLSGREALEAELKKAAAEIETLKKAAADEAIKAQSAAQAREASEALHGTQSTTRDIKSGTRIMEMDKADAAKAAQEKARADAEAAKQRERAEAQRKREAGQHFGRAMRDAGQAGANKEGLEDLGDMFADFQSGDESRKGELIAMLKALQAFMERNRQETAEIKATLESLRSGH